LDGETAVLWLQDGTAVTSDQLREKIQGTEDVSWVLGSASNAEVPQMAELADSLENASAGPLSSQYGTLGALGQAWGYAALTGPYQVPEPSTLVLLVFGLAVFGWKRACY
ncbi:MAG: PEP-CTERM sorting domain-containing protein, partial [Thermoguttaceae bacterium]|nr:PEP-CTERM sorting domain-containing protein [Thermoguttaceae bacterium]